MTDAIAFRAAGPRAQLIAIYARVGRDLAALSLAEGDGAGQRTLISQAVLTALASGSGRTEQATAAAFEPPSGSQLEARGDEDPGRDE